VSTKLRAHQHDEVECISTRATRKMESSNLMLEVEPFRKLYDLFIVPKVVTQYSLQVACAILRLTFLDVLHKCCLDRFDCDQSICDFAPRWL